MRRVSSISDDWLLYRDSNHCKRFGSLRSTQLYEGSARRMIYGVKKVVTTDTDTTIGYILASSTPRLMPKVAMMNENSPI